MKISLFYDHVTVLDYAYLDEQSGVVGNAVIVNVEFMGQTDDEGILYDFSYAKKKVKEIIDRDCDHRLVVPKNLVKYEDKTFTMDYKFGFNDKSIKYAGPSEAICELPFSTVAYSTIESHLEEIIMKEMPHNVLGLKITLVDEDLGEKPVFHYTHGLKEHYGNCQRLLHGHKNSVNVWVNGEFRDDLCYELATRLFKGNIHFCFLDNVVNKEEVLSDLQGKRHGRLNEISKVEIKYESSQGVFWGELPAEEVYIMEEESTVENLAIHFATIIKQELSPLDTVTVQAFEGVAKGAIATV